MAGWGSQIIADGRIIKYFILLFTVVLAVGSSSHEEYADGREYRIIKNKFFCLKFDTFSLFGDQAINLINGSSSDRFLYTILPLNEAALPDNWKYLITENSSFIYLYGLAYEHQSDLTELELIQFDLQAPSSIKAKIGLRFLQDEDQSRRQLVELKAPKIELAFFYMPLIRFLDADHHSSVDALFHESVWPGSRLVEVRAFDTGTVIVVSNQNIDRPVERLRGEVQLATGGGNKRLCRYKKSKTISIEHLFRRHGLYPNWCSFKIVASS